MKELHEIFLEHPKISIDTRIDATDSIFFCLKGKLFDGNDYVNQAFDEGAFCVITEDEKFKNDPRCIVVENSLETFHELSSWYRKKLKFPIIGITGTNGKTTTKELITSVLSKKFKVTSTKGNLNNHIGVPLTILSMKLDDDIGVVEMGANHTGEIEDLCEIVLPDYGIITNIGKAHLEGFENIENIISTKIVLYDFVKKRNGILFVNSDDDLLMEKSKLCDRRFYGKDSSNDVFGCFDHENPFLEMTISNRKVKTHLFGSYNVDNVLCAACVGNFFGVSEDDVFDSISNYVPDSDRSKVERMGTNLVIKDFYNANPTSMKKALIDFDAMKNEKKMVILGDMKELGSMSAEEHKNIMDLCDEFSFEKFFIGNDFCDQRSSKKNCFETIEKFDEFFDEFEIKNAMILIKGSRAMHLENLKFLKKLTKI